MTESNRIRSLTLVAATLAFASTAGHAAPTAEQIGVADGSVRNVLIRGSTPSIASQINFGSPVAFGLDWGDVALAAGGAYDPDVRVGREFNGSLAVALGLGDAVKAVAVEVTGGVNRAQDSAGSSNDDYQGAFSAKLHTVLPARAALAVGVDSFGRFGDGTKRNKMTSVYVVGTKYYDLNPNGSFKYPVGISAGFGNGRFLRASKADDQASVFGSLEFIFTPISSLTVDWQGNDLNLLASIAPLARVPVVVSVGGTNLTHQDNNRAAYVVNLGYQIKL